MKLNHPHIRVFLLTWIAFFLIGTTCAQNAGDNQPNDSSNNDGETEETRHDFDVQLAESFDTILCLTQVSEGDSVFVPFINAGNVKLSTLDYTYDIGNQIIGPLQWSGDVATNDTGYLSIAPFINPGVGQIVFHLFTANPNGVQDSNPSNDTIEVTVIIGDVPQLPSSLIHAEICIHDTLAIGSNLPQGYSFYWPAVQDTARVQNISESGSYLVEASSQDGCTSIAQYLVDYFPVPDADWLDRDTFCLNASPKISVSSKFTSFSWSGSGTVLRDSVFIPSQTGQIGLDVTDTNNCSFSFDTSIHVSDEPAVTYPQTVDFCEGEFASVNPAIIQSQSNFTFRWSDGNSSHSRKFGSPGSYQVTVTNEFGCVKMDSIDVIENDLPQPQIVGPASFCTGKSITVASDKIFSQYRWNTGNKKMNQTVHSGGNYEMTVTDQNQCENNTSIYIEELKPRFDLGNDTLLCKGDALLIDLDGSGSKFKWNDGQLNSRRTISNPGTYSVSVTDSLCTFIDTFIVSEIKKPEVNFDFDVDNFSVYFTSAAIFADSLQWTFEPGVFSNRQNPVYTFNEIGTFPVQLSAFNICGAKTITRNISVGSIGVLNEDVFEQFSLFPNPVASGDHLNVRLSSHSGSRVQLKIYDALGHLMFERRALISGKATQISLNLNAVAAGNYFLVVSSDENSSRFETKQFVVTK